MRGASGRGPRLYSRKRCNSNIFSFLVLSLRAVQLRSISAPRSTLAYTAVLFICRPLTRPERHRSRRNGDFGARCGAGCPCGCRGRRSDGPGPPTHAAVQIHAPWLRRFGSGHGGGQHLRQDCVSPPALPTTASPPSARPYPATCAPAISINFWGAGTVNSLHSSDSRSFSRLLAAVKVMSRQSSRLRAVYSGCRLLSLSAWYGA